MSLFLLSFFTIYGLAHLYVFTRIRAALAFGPRWGVLLSLFMALMVVAPVIVWFAENRGLEKAARLTALVGYVWLGLLFIFLSLSLALDIYRLGVHAGGFVSGKDLSALLPAPRGAFFVFLGLTVGAFLYGYTQARDVRLEHLTIRSPKVNEPLKIVQISDVHLGLIVRAERLNRILEKVRAEEPDILVSTGDLVDGQINRLPGLAELLAEIKPRYGKFAVTGNHEFYAGLKQALEFTNRAGFRVLRNEAVTVADRINIAGVDDPTGANLGQFVGDGEDKLLASLPRDRFTLLLKHRPRVSGDSKGMFDLQLSGHTHKGQIFPFEAVVRIPYPMIAGLYRMAGSDLYVSRGTGTWGPPIRIMSPPEVTVIEIVGDDAQGESGMKAP